MKDIFFWTRHDKHGFCSNFSPCLILIDNRTYPTVEHYYQAQKTLDPEERNMILRCKTPGEAKLAGYHVKLRLDWEEAKEEVMLKGLRAKFTQCPKLKEYLLETGNAALHEDSPWDKYWGYAKGEGKDRLGKLLMQVREEIRG